MSSIQRVETTVPELPQSSASPLAHAFINTLRTVSAERTQEREALARVSVERDAYRESYHATLAALHESQRNEKRLEYNYFDLLAKQRSYFSGKTDYEERMKIDEAHEMQFVIDRYEARQAQAAAQRREAA